MVRFEEVVRDAVTYVVQEDPTLRDEALSLVGKFYHASLSKRIGFNYDPGIIDDVISYLDRLVGPPEAVTTPSGMLQLLPTLPQSEEGELLTALDSLVEPEVVAALANYATHPEELEADPGLAPFSELLGRYEVGGDGIIREVGDDTKILSIPDQDKGLVFEIGPSEKFKLSRSGFPVGSDVEQIREFHKILSDAADDLLESARGSNAYAFLSRLALRYRDALGATPDTASIDQVYAYGVRLETALSQMNGRIASGDYPEAAPAVSEALTSLIAVHGPAVMLTERGKELRLAAADYADLAPDDDAKKLAIEFSHAVRDNKAILEADDADTLVDLNESTIATPVTRATQVALAADANLLAALARQIIAHPVTATLVGEVVVQSIVGQSIVGTSTTLFNAAYRFFLAHPGLLHQMATLTGPDLVWLDAFMKFLARRFPAPGRKS